MSKFAKQVHHMRLLALIILIFVCFLFCLSTAFKFADWPGGSLGLLTGSLIYIVIYTPLYLIYALGNSTLQPVKANIIAGATGTAVGIIGLMFFNLRWEGAELMLIVGALALIPAIVLFFKNRDTYAELFKSYRVFSIITILIMLLSASCIIPVIAKNNRMEEHIQLYTDAKESQSKAADQLRKMAEKISLQDSTQAALFDSHKAYANVDLFILEIQLEIMSMAAGYRINNMNEVQPDYIPWDDYDLTTYLLVGDNVKNPPGRGKDILSELQGLKTNLHSKGVELNITLPTNKPDNVKWINDHFYKKDIAETMAFLFTLRTELTNQLRLEVENNIAPNP